MSNGAGTCAFGLLQAVRGAGAGYAAGVGEDGSRRAEPLSRALRRGAACCCRLARRGVPCRRHRVCAGEGARPRFVQGRRVVHQVVRTRRGACGRRYARHSVCSLSFSGGRLRREVVDGRRRGRSAREAAQVRRARPARQAVLPVPQHLPFPHVRSAHCDTQPPERQRRFADSGGAGRCVYVRSAVPCAHVGDVPAVREARQGASRMVCARRRRAQGRTERRADVPDVSGARGRVFASSRRVHREGRGGRGGEGRSCAAHLRHLDERQHALLRMH